MTVQDKSLDVLAERGFCIDEWERWHQGCCGTYAVALIQLHPALRFGLIGDLEDDEFLGTTFNWCHAIAHDDEYAYDAGGRHRLPYHGAWGDYHGQELDLNPADYGIPDEDPGDNEETIADAIAHALRNGILEGRYTPEGA